MSHPIETAPISHAEHTINHGDCARGLSQGAELSLNVAHETSLSDIKSVSALHVSSARDGAAAHLPSVDLIDAQQNVAKVLEKDIRSGDATALQTEVEKFSHDPKLLTGAVNDANHDLKKQGIDLTYSIGGSFMDDHGQSHAEGMLRLFNQKGGAELVSMTDHQDGMLVGSVSKNNDGSYQDHVAMRGNANAALHDIVGSRHN